MENIETKIKSISVNDKECLYTFPCSHLVQITYEDGTVESVAMDSPSIVEKCGKYISDKVALATVTRHAMMYPGPE